MSPGKNDAKCAALDKGVAQNALLCPKHTFRNSLKELGLGSQQFRFFACAGHKPSRCRAGHCGFGSRWDGGVCHR